MLLLLLLSGCFYQKLDFAEKATLWGEEGKELRRKISVAIRTNPKELWKLDNSYTLGRGYETVHGHRFENCLNFLRDENGLLAMHEVVLFGNKEAADELFEFAPPTEDKTLQGEDIYDLAIREGRIDIIKRAYFHGAEDEQSPVRFLLKLLRAEMLDFLRELLSADGATELDIVCFLGERERVSELIVNNQDALDENPSGLFPLNYAAAAGHLDICKLLIDNGASIDIVEGEGGNLVSVDDETPLMTAAACGQLEVCKLLVEGGAELNLFKRNIGTAIACAARAGHLEICRFLSSRQANLDGALSFGTPAAAAVLGGHIDVCRFFITECGIPVDERSHIEDEEGDSYSDYLITLAARKNNIEMCKMLLELGADLNARSTCMSRESNRYLLQKPIHHAQYNEELFRFFLDSGALIEDEDLAHISDGSACMLLVERGLNPNFTEPFRVEANEFIRPHSILDMAVSRRDEELTKFLLAKGADPNGVSPLFEAIRHNHLSISRMLIEAGANVKILLDGALCLADSLSHGYISGSMLKTELLEKKLSENHKISLLGLATGLLLDARMVGASMERASVIAEQANNNTAIIEVLLRQGANPNLGIVNGDTPFELALQAGKHKVCMYLLSIRKIELRQGTLHLILREGHRRCNHWIGHLKEGVAERFSKVEVGPIELFKSALTLTGLDHSFDKQGDNLLTVAAANGQIKICELLLNLGFEVNMARERDGKTALMLVGDGLMKWQVSLHRSTSSAFELLSNISTEAVQYEWAFYLSKRRMLVSLDYFIDSLIEKYDPSQLANAEKRAEHHVTAKALLDASIAASAQYLMGYQKILASLTKMLITRGASTCKVDHKGMNFFAHLAELEAKQGIPYEKSVAYGLLIEGVVSVNELGDSGLTNFCYFLMAFTPERIGKNAYSRMLAHDFLSSLKASSLCTPLSREEAEALLISSVLNGNLNVLRSLLSKGVSMDAVDDEGRSALIHSILKDGREEIIKELLQAGASVNLQDAYGRTALIYAVMKDEDIQLITQLLQNGADPNIQDENGRTALMHLIMLSQSLEIMKVLISNGANLSLCDKRKRTVWEYAMMEDRSGKISMHLSRLVLNRSLKGTQTNPL